VTDYESVGRRFDSCKARHLKKGPVFTAGLFLYGGVMWYLYLCNRNGQLYTGITTDLDHRMGQHQAKLLYQETFDNKFDAAKREREIKGWSRQKKEALIKGRR
jgi:putative endonuclease